VTCASLLFARTVVHWMVYWLLYPLWLYWFSCFLLFRWMGWGVRCLSKYSLCSVTFTYAFTVIPPLTNDPANEFMNGRAIPREKFNQLWTHFSLLLYQRDRGQLLKNRRLTLNKHWKFGRRIVKPLCTYFQFNSIKCIIYFQYNSVKIVSFSFYFPFTYIQLGSCSSQPLVSFCPFIVCFFTIL
jgi:hypothetical protein